MKSNILLAGKQNSGNGGRSKNKVGQRVLPTTTASSFVAEEDETLSEEPPLTQENFDNDSITDDRSTDPFRFVSRFSNKCFGRLLQKVRSFCYKFSLLKKGLSLTIVY